MPHPNLFGTYSGVIESTKDSEKRGRMKVRVPLVYGPAEGSIPTSDLPWALPAGLPAGGSPSSGGIDWLPEVGDQVWVRFLDGEPEKPIWEWALQNSKQAKDYPFRSYDGSTPNRHALLSRYGQSIEISEAGISLVTSKGYSIQLIDSGAGQLSGSLEIQTGKAYYFKMMDDVDQLAFYCKYVNGTYTELHHQGNQAVFDLVAKFEVITCRANIKAARIDLGNGANDPVVRRSDLENVVRQIVLQFDLHTHPYVPPPETPMEVRVTASRVVYAV
jgi:hypothetical protein